MKLFRRSVKSILTRESPKRAIWALVDRLDKRRPFSEYNESERLLWCLWVLYAESKNGTIEQWATNSSGDLFAETRAQLQVLGVAQACESLDGLNDLLGGKMIAGRNERIDAVTAARSVDEPNFEARIRSLTTTLDQAWLVIFAQAVEYIRSHKDDLA